MFSCSPTSRRTFSSGAMGLDHRRTRRLWKAHIADASASDCWTGTRRRLFAQPRTSTCRVDTTGWKQGGSLLDRSETNISDTEIVEGVVDIHEDEACSPPRSPPPFYPPRHWCARALRRHLKLVVPGSTSIIMDTHRHPMDTPVVSISDRGRRKASLMFNPALFHASVGSSLPPSLPPSLTLPRPVRFCVSA